MATRKRVLSLPVPGVRALRWSSDELYVGMKETYTVTRVEAGRSSFFTRGKVWSSAAGSLRIQAPGDVVRDLSRDGTGVDRTELRVIDCTRGSVRGVRSHRAHP